MIGKEFEKFPQDLKELNSFIDKHQNKLVHHAYYRVGDKQQAEDIVQDVFVKVYIERDRFKEMKNPVSYLFKMVSNACIDHLRKSRKIETESAENSVELNRKENDEDHPLIIAEEYAKINRILSSLPEEQSEVIRYKVIDELSFVEIAGINEIPVSTVKSRFKYGIEKLKNFYLKQKEVQNELRYF
jgi:RNA polymerase sigma-70 factor, ECF subfamily